MIVFIHPDVALRMVSNSFEHSREDHGPNACEALDVPNDFQLSFVVLCNQISNRIQIGSNFIDDGRQTKRNDLQLCLIGNEDHPMHFEGSGKLVFLSGITLIMNRWVDLFFPFSLLGGLG